MSTRAIAIASKLIKSDAVLLSHTRDLISTLDKTDNKVDDSTIKELNLTCYITDKFNTTDILKGDKDVKSCVVYQRSDIVQPEVKKSKESKKCKNSFLMYVMEQREEDEFVTRQTLSLRWKSVPEDEKYMWAEKADIYNKENGLKFIRKVKAKVFLDIPLESKSICAWWYTNYSIGNPLLVVNNPLGSLVVESEDAPSITDLELNRFESIRIIQNSMKSKRIVIKLPIDIIKEIIKE